VGVRVLVVDDDAMIVLLLKLNLELEGHEVLTAADGPGALHAAFEHRPDVVLLDVVLAGVDGLEVCRRLRADPLTQTTPVVFLTGLAQATDMERGVAAGCDAYVTKPFDPLDLVALVERLGTPDEPAGDAMGTAP
jgi:CheY-like chemotaxis protein